MRVGYIRVSSVDQNTVRQLDGIAVERAFTDTVSGKDTARPRLEEMLAFVREGDAVIVHSMDRLARNLDDLRRLVRTLTGKGVRVEFVKENLAFTGEDSPMATLLLSVMGAFAEFERALILERQREGMSVLRPENRRPRWPGSSASAVKPSTATCARPTPQASWAEDCSTSWIRNTPRPDLHRSANRQESRDHTGVPRAVGPRTPARRPATGIGTGLPATVRVGPRHRCVSVGCARLRVCATTFR
jgi:hypothetical protein